MNDDAYVDLKATIEDWALTYDIGRDAETLAEHAAEYIRCELLGEPREEA